MHAKELAEAAIRTPDQPPGRNLQLQSANWRRDVGRLATELDPVFRSFVTAGSRMIPNLFSFSSSLFLPRELIALTING